jgi:hypothetical protein
VDGAPVAFSPFGALAVLLLLLLPLLLPLLLVFIVALFVTLGAAVGALVGDTVGVDVGCLVVLIHFHSQQCPAGGLSSISSIESLL